MLRNSTSSKTFETLDLKTSIIHETKFVEVIFFQNFKMEAFIEDVSTNHCFILSDLTQPFLNRFYNINFEFPKLTTSIFLRLKTIQFKMESIFKMAILRLSISLSEPLNLVFSPFSDLQSSTFGFL
jgi:hypothetical protein